MAVRCKQHALPAPRGQRDTQANREIYRRAFLATSSFRFFPGLNTGTTLAGTLIFFPV